MQKIQGYTKTYFYNFKNEDEIKFYKKKIGDFANAVTFGMRAGEKWGGTNEVNGGIYL